MNSLPLHAQEGKPNQEITFIYRLRDPETKRIRYVGKANNPQLRLVRHLREKYKSYKNTWLAGLKEKGLVPELEIIEEVQVYQWQARERFWIAYYREQGEPLTNDTDGGDGVHGRKRTPEEKARIGAASKGNQYAKGNKPSPQTRAKRSAALKGHPVSPEAAERIAASKRGVPRSPETKAKLSSALVGKKFSEERKEKMRGRTLSEERKKQISMQQSGKKVSEATREKLRAREYSEESKVKMSLAQRGRTRTEEQKKTLSKRAIELGIKPPSRKGIPVTSEAKEKSKATWLAKNQDEIQAKHILGDALRSDHASGMTYRQLAAKYNSSQGHVGRVIKKEAWQ